MDRLESTIILLLMFISPVILSCGQNTPLTDYEPRSDQEQALKNILLEYQDAANAKNSDKIVKLISENASIMVGRERKILSKKQYIEILPERFAENLFVSFGKAKMTISGDKAEVKMYVTRGDTDSLVVFDMRFESDQWHIHGWSY